ncbi:hypothetical protein GQ43DRAFT_468605 [Delitschia confertaspora ATCC 74209]|uniref:HMG box domain-containing protein n=1 Tax=Delitschia confertaspora ATCC 74209 TaxID=1513339 RepID=A0A9P4JYT7_9PLEO|nr:hypothetical protein GQ43DRAFT_468605 [Delitschia confertaspora ATCC 74209]
MAATTKSATTAPKAKAAVNGGVKKAPPGRKLKGGKASTAMAKMQAYFREHRAEFSSLAFKDQQKELGKLWKAAPENPKNAASS